MSENPEPALSWHDRTADDACALLATGPGGLASEEARRRHAHHGPNIILAAKPRAPLAMLLGQFADFMILVLIGAALVSGLIGDVKDTVLIVAIVILNAIIGFVQEFRAARAIEALRQLAAPAATVLRDGAPRSVSARELVPGDIVLLEAGNIVPADLRLVATSSLAIDESVLTGESVPVDKHSDALTHADVAIADRRNIAHKGTVVTYGRATGVVVATGMHTELGRIAHLLARTEASQTPLQRRLAVFGRRLAIAVIAICAIVFATGLLRGEAALPMLLTALSLAVAAIPSALPAVVSVSLAIGAHKMLARRALIRRLPAVEALGSVTYICSDKTGTLTLNRMSVDGFWCDGARTGAPGRTAPWHILLTGMALNNDAAPDTAGGWIGDPTEVALAVAAAAAGYERGAVEARLPRVAELPFDSVRKRMTTLHRDVDGDIVCLMKGAPEIVLELATRECRGGERIPIDRAPLMRQVEAMAADGLRVMAFASRRLETLPARADPASLERDLDFVGLVGLIDPPRPEAREAIATCCAAGIVPVMITGDHPVTARAIAARLGLLDDDHEVTTGRQLAALEPAALAEHAMRTRVYARVSPEQKLDIVVALQRRGEVVAMTGDGVNDAPALQRADIGVAMGRGGTDVAREASSLVLLDDNFATVVGAVAEGRRIYDNLRRFIRYALTTNSAEIWTIFLAPFLGLPIPLIPVQILWINLVTDGLPGLALAAEPAERDVMERRPRAPSESIFAGGLGWHAFLVGLAMAGLTLGALAWSWHAGSATWQTIAFTALCLAQLAHVLAIRSERTSLFTQGSLSNWPLFAAVVATVAAQLAVVYAAPLNDVFGTVPLAPVELAVCFGVAIAVFGMVEFEKAWRRASPRRARAAGIGAG